MPAWPQSAIERACSLVLAAAFMYALIACTTKPESSPPAMPDPAPAAIAPPVAKGCCDGVDEKDLPAVAKCYTLCQSPIGLWHFLSTDAQKERTQAQFDLDLSRQQRDGHKVIAVDVIGNPTTLGDSTYARTSVTWQAPTCTEVTTAMWIREGEAWRHHDVYRPLELAKEKLGQGSYLDAVSLLEEITKSQPYSIDAHNQLRYALYRAGKLTKARRDEILRSVASINPKDSSGLLSTITEEHDPEIRSLLFEKLGQGDCWYSDAVFNTATGLPKREVAPFLRAHPCEDQALKMILIDALSAEGKHAEVLQVLDQKVREAIEKKLSKGDPAFAAYWASRLALALLAADDRAGAKAFADLGFSRDPTDREVREAMAKVAKATARAATAKGKE